MEFDLFGELVVNSQSNNGIEKYTTKVETPIYEPKGRCPHILELVNSEKTKRMIREIEMSDISEDEKDFLKIAATRHAVFNYTKIADYYAHATKEMQRLMEKSALVIIDFDKSIEYGFTHLQKEIKKEWIKNKQIQALNNEK